MVKRIVKLIVSIFYFTKISIMDFFANTVLKKEKSKRLLILYYHSIPSELKTRFLTQVKMICNHCEVIKAHHFSTSNEGKSYLSITFDDGFISVMNNALPVLEKYKLPATIFVPTKFIGTVPIWNTSSKYDISNERVMSETELKSLNRDLFSIGSHTVSHKSLTSLAWEDLNFEITKSKETLERILDYQINSISFPHGAFNYEVIEVSKSAGYSDMHTVLPGYNYLGQNGFLLNRIWTDPSDWKIEFWLKLRGAYNWKLK